MKVQVIGTGIVGEATAYLAKYMGYSTYGYDIEQKWSPHYEGIKAPISNCDLTFVCTPEGVLEEVIANLVSNHIPNITVRSTTKPGMLRRIMERCGVELCHNPEFLREATYLRDALHPPFVLVGGRPFPELIKFYQPLKEECKVIYTSLEVSEMAKLTLNNYLATQVAFWCEVEEVCRGAGLDGKEIGSIISNDKRVSGYGFNPIGVGFSGKCLSKDLRQVIEFAHSIGTNPKLFEAIEDFNKMFEK